MLATAAAALAAQQLASPQLATAQESASQGSSDMLRVAILGCGIRGKQHAHDLGEVPGCEIVYVCDPDIDRVHELASAVEKQQGTAPQAVRDMRRVFDDKSVDAVFIAAPDHWHALAAIWAMESGKDAYVEKPVSHNIAEGAASLRQHASWAVSARREHRTDPTVLMPQPSNTFKTES